MFTRFSLFLCTASLCGAQSLSLDDAIRLAWANDPSLPALAAQSGVITAREVQATDRPPPEIELRTGLPVGGDSEWSVGFGLSRRLVSRERTELARALARAGAEPAEQAIREQRRRVAGEVRQFYYQAVVLREKHIVAERAERAVTDTLAALERLLAAGEISALEVELTRLEADRATQARVFAAAEYTGALSQLRRRLRTGAAALVAPAESLRALLTAPLPEEETPPDPAHPRVALANAVIREAEVSLALARAEGSGEWTLGAGIDFERRANDATGRLANEPALSLQASKPWPQPDTRRGLLLEKQALVRLAEANAAAIREEVRTEAAGAYATARALQPVLLSALETLARPDAALARLQAAQVRGEIPAHQLALARQQRFALEQDFLAAAGRYLETLAAAQTAAGLMPHQS